MTELMDLGVIFLYNDKIGDYAEEYGPELWWLIYQADVRFRSEHVQRIYTYELTDEERADKPWEAAFAKGMEDKEFWYSELEKPALISISKRSSLIQAGGDATVAKDKKEHAANTIVMPAPYHESMSSTTRTIPTKPTIDKKTAGKLQRGTAGTITQLPNGLYPCHDYQCGKCKTGTGNQCTQDKNATHVCELCGQPGHGSSFRTERCTAQHHKASSSNKGGKGGKSGKGGKNKWGSWSPGATW